MWIGLICLRTGKSDKAVVSMLMTLFSISSTLPMGLVNVCYETKDVICIVTHLCWCEQQVWEAQKRENKM